jgi:hemoglobin-like flavoprotein
MEANMGTARIPDLNDKATQYHIQMADKTIELLNAYNMVDMDNKAGVNSFYSLQIDERPYGMVAQALIASLKEIVGSRERAYELWDECLAVGETVAEGLPRMIGYWTVQAEMDAEEAA